jgi:hypothetical protein
MRPGAQTPVPPKKKKKKEKKLETTTKTKLTNTEHDQKKVLKTCQNLLSFS